MKKTLSKIIFLIFSASLFLGTSVNLTEAFLDSDLGLNLYSDLDKGLSDFEEKMYIYELRGQNKKDIATNINKILYNKGIGNCIRKGIIPKEVDQIADGDINVLKSNITEECYNPENLEFSNKKFQNIINEFGNIKRYYSDKARDKAKSIHEISRIGMYSDGNLENSPFDIINDINDINAIIFTEESEYENEDSNFLKEYQKKPLSCSSSPAGNRSNNRNNTPNRNGNNNSANHNNGNSGENNGGDNGGNTYRNSNGDNTPDGNNYICPDDSNNSGLDETSLEGLVGSIKGNGSNTSLSYVYDNSSLATHVPLPETNTVSINDLTSSSCAGILSGKGVGPYEKVTDNDLWKCNDFFCIITEFIIRRQNALDYGSSHSIQNIIETSNKHLKKSANTSLVQSKMTTNNFEISLRDLSLPDIFHLGINLSYKTPPILNLEKLPGNPEKHSRDEIKNMLREKYRDMGLNYENPNNLNKFSYALRKIKQIFLTGENSANYYGEIDKTLTKTLKLRSKILDYNKETIHKDLNNKIIEDFDKQFNEISQFNINIMDYVDGLDILIKKLKEIPTYSG